MESAVLPDRLVPDWSGATYQVENPSTGEPLAAAPDLTEAQANGLVEEASGAFPGWRREPVQSRAAAVRALAGVLERHAEELAALDALDTGVPLWMMRKDVRTGIARMRMFADWALLLRGETIPSAGDHLHYTERVPYGPVARIIAFNHPAMFAVSKVAAPLVAGNTVVLKPSELTPLSALRIAELAADVLPPGVLATATGAAAGPALVRHRAVRRIAFTGGVATGRAVQESAARSGVKDVSLELGGKNALIVRPDADLDRAAAAAVTGMNLAFAGQSCGSTSRLLVHESIAEALVRRVRDLFTRVPVGDPMDPGTRMGPLISDAARARALSYVESADLIQGGRPLDGPGHFMEPALVRAEPGAAVATDEIFGPVLAVLPFRADDEAVRIANAVDHGLTGAVFTRDLGAAHRIARDLDAGYVWINETSTHHPAVPFGGVKDSGVGREESLEELHGYTQVKAINVGLAG